MKMKLRKPALFLLLMTVIAPIVLYTDNRFGSFRASSTRDEYIEDISTFTLGVDVRALNLLPQEPLTTLKEPLGIVFVENNTAQDSSATTGESIRKNSRQLTEESTENQTTTTTTTNKESEIHNHTLDENPIKQVTERKRKGGKQEAVNGSGSSSSKLNSPSMVAVVADNGVLQLKDQLIRGRVYLSLSATRNNPHFVRDLRLRMKEIQRLLGEATKDSELPKGWNDKSKIMEQTLAKGKQIQDDCTATVKKLRAMLQSTEEQVRVHKKQALFLTHLTAKTMPKGLHCLPLRLTTEYFTLDSSKRSFPNQENLDNPSLYHYALFTDNVLAAAVVVNSTISHAKDPAKHVFHIVTDRLNHAAMSMWFLSSPPGKATIQVQNIEEFTWLNSSYSPVLKQLGSQSMIDYYFKARRSDSDPNLKYRNPKYLSIMNHLRFYLPEIFPKLNKVLFLDDDIVVRKDLTRLWDIDMKGKVNGAVETCGENFHRFDRYLNFSNPLISKNFDPRACGWAYGMNVFDLKEWRRQNITEIYHSWQNLNRDRQLWKLGTLPPGLITFWNRTYPLDRSWHVLGLGYNPTVSPKEIDRSAVIHYNGNLKPWLEIAILKFRSYWTKFVDYDHAYLRECNINP